MIRPYRPGDHVAIAEIFPRAVHEIASGVYSEEQCAAWSAKDPDPGYWKERCARKQPYVFVVADRVAGFCELDPDGHIDCTDVHPDHKRKGMLSLHFSGLACPWTSDPDFTPVNPCLA